MRIYGTLSGKIRNQGVETYYREGEESEKWKNYEIEIIDVKVKDSAETYPSLWLRFGYKGKLRFEDAEITGNKIALDAQKIENDTVVGIKNVCGALVKHGKFPITVAEKIEKTGRNGYCYNCKYRKTNCDNYKASPEVMQVDPYSKLAPKTPWENC
ncbi:MAG: hypothetical protein ACI37Z_05165 [Candidatus Gastranaerophilaceae bacterium]